MSKTETAAQLGFELHTAARLLTRSRWQVLWLLQKEQGLKQAEMAERMDIAPISLTRQIDLLEQEGLVERRPDPQDRRCFRVYLTAAAEPVIVTLRRLAREVRDEALAEISVEEQKLLINLLGRLRVNLGREEVVSD